MGVLQRFERRLGGLVEGAFARIFKGAVEPAEVASALRREASDRKRVLGAGRILVPNEYVVELSPSDYGNFSSYGQPMREELATMLQASIADNGWTTFGEIEVNLDREESLETGMFRVTSEVRAAGTRRPPARRDDRERPDSRPEPSRPEPSQPDRSNRPEAAAESTQFQSSVSEPTVVARYPVARLVDAESGQEYRLHHGSTVIGRSDEADIRLPDVSISRRHARLTYDGARVVASDLGSTNGTIVNGSVIEEEQELSTGDRLQLGGTTLVVSLS